MHHENRDSKSVPGVTELGPVVAESDPRTVGLVFGIAPSVIGISASVPRMAESVPRVTESGPEVVESDSGTVGLVSGIASSVAGFSASRPESPNR